MFSLAVQRKWGGRIYKILAGGAQIDPRDDSRVRHSARSQSNKVRIRIVGDPKYPESSAYHEAGHIVAAAAQGMKLSHHGIHLDADGRGISYYKYRKPKRFWDAPQDVERESTIVATLAGLIAQQKFYPDCSTLGASDDTNLVDTLLSEIETEGGILGFAEATAPQIELKQKAERLVDSFWPAIEEIAHTLWQTPETPRNFGDPEPDWSALSLERKLDGVRLIEILASYGINTSIWTPILLLIDFS